MFAALIIATILVAGYIYAHQHFPTRYRLTRTDGWHSYFYVAYRGALFGILSAILCFTMDYFDCVAKYIKPNFNLLLSDFDHMLISVNYIKASAWAVVTLTLAQFAGWLSRAYFSLFPSRKDIRLINLVQENHIEHFVVEASLTQFPIIVTLSSRKTYVGLCYGSELSNGEMDSIAILPYLSGYRDKDDLTFEDTTDYFKHYTSEGIIDGNNEDLSLEDFRVVLPQSEIETYAFFDLDTYIKFKQEEKKLKQEKLGGVTRPIYPSSFRIND